MTRLLIIGAVAVVIAGAAGYIIGSNSGSDLAAARTSGRVQGLATGLRDGRRLGNNTGLAAGRRQTYRRAYRAAYHTAYRRVVHSSKGPTQTASSPALAPAIDCPGAGNTNITGVSIRFMTCGQAQGIIDNFGAISAHFTVLGFSCDRLSGGDLGGTWRCVRGQQALRFGFGD